MFKKKRFLSYCFALSLFLTGCSFEQGRPNTEITWEEIQDYPSILVYANESVLVYDHIEPESGEHYLVYFIEGHDEAIFCKSFNSDGTLYREQGEEYSEGI